MSQAWGPTPTPRARATSQARGVTEARRQKTATILVVQLDSRTTRRQDGPDGLAEAVTVKDYLGTIFNVCAASRSTRGRE